MPHFSPTATWIKNGGVLGKQRVGKQPLYLHNISKEDSGTYICRVQLETLISEKSLEIIVQCKCVFNDGFVNVSLTVCTAVSIMCI